jgi:hypothetical protein
MKRIHWGSISSIRPSKRSSSLYHLPSSGLGVTSGAQPARAVAAPITSAARRAMAQAGFIPTST